MYPLDFDTIGALIEEQEAYSRERNQADKDSRRELKFLTCGQVICSRINPYTGEKKLVFSRCNQYRRCERCRKLRASKLRTHWRRKIGDKEIQFGIYYDRKIEFETERESKEFISALDGKESYKRYPLEDGTFLVIFANDYKMHNDDQPGELLTDTVIDSMDWDYIASTPEGRKITGSYGDDCQPDREGCELISYEVPTVDAPMRDADDAMEQAILETSDLDPQDGEQVELAIMKRTDVFLRIITEMGHHIVYWSHRMMWLEIKSINWHISADRAMEDAEQREKWRKNRV